MTSFEPVRPRDPQAFYEVGTTPFFACAADPRFSYTLYLPERDPGERLPLLVIAHDTLRTPERYRDVFAEWANTRRVAVLAPLFPAGHGLAWDLHAYKLVDAFGVRYDQVLLAMIAESADRFGFDGSRFFLFGFSGGAQFTERFLLLHPDRLRACSIAAPGAITLLDPESAWWVGVQDVEERFGRPLDVDAMRRVAVQTIVGLDDVETWELEGDAFVDHPLWMPGAARAGRTRLDRARTLSAMLREAGVPTEHVEVPGVAHLPHGLFPEIMAFLDRQLAARPGSVA
ncbi:alpha/beta hydrolase [Cryptosporangium aurantiacum]|uniref:Acetyl esterase/lipase n=1 Tax=Cryptosporangium aurantiacum TaxID=134849 RepID=A0A1M7RJ80_9ACTN|nr:alpha/beta hydrolase [Cryptosporangium aurantiacum]SHN46324.1 Acetyl esterase/lipase [Cryptosporangium aurantiacum]